MSFETIPAPSASAVLAGEAMKPVIEQTIPANATMADPVKAALEGAIKEKEEVKPPEEKDLFSERFASLTKKEKRLLKEKEEAKALRAAIAQKEAEINKKEQLMTQFEELKRSNPLKALELLGLNYNDLTNSFLNADNPSPEFQVQSVRKELEDFKRQQEEARKKAIEDAKIKEEQSLTEVVANFKSEINAFVASKDDYEYINHFEQTELVYDTIQEYFDKNKKILSIKEASDLVEKYLEEQVKKTTATKKFSKLYTPQPQNTEASPTKEQPRTNPAQSRTLTNNMTSSASTPSPARTEQDRIQRALAALDRK